MKVRALERVKKKLAIEKTKELRGYVPHKLRCDPLKLDIDPHSKLFAYKSTQF